MTDHLFNKDKLVQMSLFMGFIWGVWHLPLYFYPAQLQHRRFVMNPIFVEIVIDVLFFVIITRTKFFKKRLDSIR